MALELKTAERKKAKLRIGIAGPSGSGKTYSALLLAFGITGDWSKVAVIDTENSAELYSHLGAYQVLNLQAPYSPERYIEAIELCIASGIETIIIDSTSHEWDGKGGCLEINERIAQAKFRGNTWSAWSETTPRHQRFIETIITAPIHIITATRSKTETIMTDDKKVKKVGMKDIQREGFEYELTLNFNLDRDRHMALASKDRTELFIHADPFVINAETGKTLKAWAEEGKEAPVDHTAIKERIMSNLRNIHPMNQKVERAYVEQLVKELTGLDLTEANFVAIDAKLVQLNDKAKTLGNDAHDAAADQKLQERI